MSRVLHPSHRTGARLAHPVGSRFDIDGAHCLPREWHDLPPRRHTSARGAGPAGEDGCFEVGGVFEIGIVVSTERKTQMYFDSPSPKQVSNLARGMSRLFLQFPIVSLNYRSFRRSCGRPVCLRLQSTGEGSYLRRMMGNPIVTITRAKKL